MQTLIKNISVEYHLVIVSDVTLQPVIGWKVIEASMPFAIHANPSNVTNKECMNDYSHHNLLMPLI